MDKKTLQFWALVAEVIAGLAVVVTLVFLALEMRDNTNASQAQTYQILMQELNDYRTLFVEPEILAIANKRRSHGWENLSTEDKQKLWVTDTILWGIYESAYFANSRDVMGAAEWTRFEAAICRNYKNRAELWAGDASAEIPSISDLLTSQFAEFVLTKCEMR